MLAGATALAAPIPGQLMMAAAQAPAAPTITPNIPPPATTPGAGSIPDGFTRIFNGKDATGWHPSRTSHHGRTPSVTVKNGAMYILQEPFGMGGVVLSDKQYGNFEFYVETDLRPGYNSGIFVRSTEEASAYQIELDALAGNGNPLGEMMNNLGRPERENFTPIASVWKQGEWNSFRLRVEGAAPQITLWVNGAKIWTVKYPVNGRPDGSTKGFIGLQYHFLTAMTPSGMVMPLT
ncbi:MAG: hypothetical protein BGN86_13285, partial [Caulobacterales bacterium 68-7]